MAEVLDNKDRRNLQRYQRYTGDGGLGVDQTVSTIDNLSQEKRAASNLRREQQPARRGQKALQTTSTGLKAAHMGVTFSKDYRWTKGHKALGYAGTVTGAYAEGRGTKGAIKDVAWKEAKRRTIRKLIVKAGLGEASMGLSVLLEAKSLAKSLRNAASNGKNFPYIIMTVVAATKDLIDIFSLELISLFDWVIDLFIWGLLFFFLWGKGTWKVKFLVRIVGWFEVIPAVGIIPTWTLCVLYAWKEQHADARKKEEKADEIDKSIKQVEAVG